MFKRRRFTQFLSLEERLGQEAITLQQEAEALPQGQEREQLLRKARQAKTGSHIGQWLRSAGLQPPR